MKWKPGIARHRRRWLLRRYKYYDSGREIHGYWGQD